MADLNHTVSSGPSPDHDPMPPHDEAAADALASQTVEAAEALAHARAASERALLEAATSKHAISENERSRTMSGNVRFCPVSEANRLPKPPRPPEDPTEADMIVAAGGEASEGAKLSPAQQVALASLMCGQTAIVAARRAGVSPRTIHRWRQEPAFTQTLDRLTDDSVDAATRRLRTLLLRSTHVIADALQGGDQYRWAMRLVTSPQVWKMGRRDPKDAEKK